MDDTLLFIPPCCVDRKLPRAMKEAPRRMLSFYTQGDVTMEKFYRAISCEMIDQHVMVLAMPRVVNVTNETFAFLLQCFEREWISHLILSTAQNVDELVDKYLGEYKDRVLYTRSKDVSAVSSHMVLYSNDRALLLQGPMLEAPKMGLTAYTLMFYPNHGLSINTIDWGNPLKNILLPDVLRHRQQVHKDKRKVKDDVLANFLAASFPPYSNGNEEGHNDRHNFSNI